MRGREFGERVLLSPVGNVQSVISDESEGEGCFFGSLKKLTGEKWGRTWRVSISPHCRYGIGNF